MLLLISSNGLRFSDYWCCNLLCFLLCIWSSIYFTHAWLLCMWSFLSNNYDNDNEPCVLLCTQMTPPSLPILQLATCVGLGDNLFVTPELLHLQGKGDVQLICVAMYCLLTAAEVCRCSLGTTQVLLQEQDSWTVLFYFLEMHASLSIIWMFDIDARVEAL